jgi:FixJ family two-component response regulator
VVAIVDDDDSVRQAVEGLMRSAGLPVATFSSADEFLRWPEMETTGCLILDLQMPGMPGLELQERLIRGGHRIPVVVLTAHGDDEARVRAVDAGAVAFMPKPFDGDALVKVVEAAVSRA